MSIEFILHFVVPKTSTIGNTICKLLEKDVVLPFEASFMLDFYREP